MTMDAVSPKVRDDICRRLDEIERDEEVRILFACESGSRAWGFASQDSDFDVRFFYVHKPQWYLSVDLPYGPRIGPNANR